MMDAAPTQPPPPSVETESARSVAMGTLVTSAAALLTGMAAFYLLFTEQWGASVFDALRGQGTLGSLTVTGAWTVILPAATVTLSLPLIMLLQRRWFPGTEGTGIPQAIAALAVGPRPERRMMLSLRIALGKLLLLTIALVTGITVGREGPSVHVGACLMHLSGRVYRLPAWVTDRGLILAGAAAGISAAFNTPVAGLIFCFEEVGRTFPKKNVFMIMRTVALACAVGILIEGDYLFYTGANSHAQLPAVPLDKGLVGALDALRAWCAIPFVALIGGTLGGLFGKAVVVASGATGRLVTRHPVRVGLALGLLLAGIGVLSGGSSYGGGYPEALQMLLSAHATGVPTAEWYMPFAKAAASFLCLISAIPGGLFDPSLTIGAGLGQVTFVAFRDVFGPGLELPSLMLLFMAAYFTGVVQSPITVFVILLQMTGANGMVVPLMLTAALAAYIAEKLCSPSIYQALAGQFLAAKGLTAVRPPLAGGPQQDTGALTSPPRSPQ